jgi:YD repeat-containing protein
MAPSTFSANVSKDDEFHSFAVENMVTSRDIFIPSFDWAFAENYREHGRFAIVSSARLRPPALLRKWNPQLFQSRVQKLLSKNIALLYFGFPLSRDPTSLLSGGIPSGSGIDLMSESIIGGEGRWDPMAQVGDPEVTIYNVPGKPPLWRMAYSSEALPDTSSQVFNADLALGLFIERQTDFHLSGDDPLQLTRVYSALDPKSRAFGIGTDHSLDTFLTGHMGSYVNLNFADGGKIRFQHVQGKPGPDNYVSNDSDYPSAVFLGGLWTVFLHDGSKLYFPYHPKALGQYVTVLTGFTDSAGHLYRMERNSAGDLISVRTPEGIWLRFDYDSEHRIRRAESSSGRVVSYAYDSKGRLSRVSDAEGHVETYTYDDKAEMLAASCGNDSPVLVNTYDMRGEIVAQRLGDCEVFKYSYVNDPDSDRDVVVPNLITAPNGLLTYFNYQGELYFQSLPERPPF